MTAPVPERAAGGKDVAVPGSLAPRFDEDDRGVSPVIGMILVLAISIVGIAAILYWGLPAIDEMKANVEYRSTTSQFSELDSTIKELVAGTTEKTAKRWQPSISRGSITVASGTEAWLYETELYNAGSPVNLTWTGLSDGDERFTLTLRTAAMPLGVGTKVEGYVVNGASSQTSLLVNLASHAGAPSQMALTDLLNWGQDTSQTFKVWKVDGTTEPLTGQTFHFKVYSGANLVAEAWYVNTGRVDYHLSAGVGSKDVILSNGAVIGGTNGAYVITNAPSIPPDVVSSGVPRFFGRALVLDGGVSVGGENRFDMLVSLYSTASLASYDCQLSTHTDCVSRVKLFDYGTYASPWNTYLSTSSGYTFSKVTDANGQVYLDDSYITAAAPTPPYMAMTLLESNLKVT